VEEECGIILGSGGRACCLKVRERGRPSGERPKKKDTPGRNLTCSVCLPLSSVQKRQLKRETITVFIYYAY